ncbi:hypothetical protein HOF92_02115 [bacterium]|jgi:hypothetical protein|nr:hypothetical protein [bacterium]
MMEDEEWLKFILEDISYFSSLKFQRHAFNNICSNPQERVISYDELWCNLFDDIDFEGFIERHRTSGKYPLELIEALCDFRVVLRLYEEPSDNPNVILADPEWVALTEMAQVTLRVFQTHGYDSFDVWTGTWGKPDKGDSRV